MKHFLTVSVLVASIFTGTHAVDGVAISVAWRSGGLNWGCSPSGAPECGGIFRGQLVRYNIQNSQIAQRDIIVDRDRALVCYPTLNFSGTQIAFYRDRKFLEGDQVRDAGQCYISVVDADGSNMRNLAEIPDLPDEETAIDWPVGEWIYYVKPQPGANSWDRTGAEIWRVNVNDPSQNNHVVTEHADFRRFSLSLDGKHMGVQLLGVGGSRIKSFPGLQEEHSGCGCNGAGSSSGTYMLNYCGWHGEIHFTTSSGTLGNRVITVSQLSDWSGASLCSNYDDPVESHCGGELMVWSVNSDKWSCHWPGVDGWAGGMSHGTNFVLVNWVDDEAITLTNYTRIVDPSSGGSGVISYGEYSGDFRVDGIEPGCYEDVNGNPVRVADVTESRSENNAANAAGQGIALVGTRIVLPTRKTSLVHITDLAGRTMVRAQAAGEMVIGDMLPDGVYLANIQSGGATRSLRIRVAR